MDQYGNAYNTEDVGNDLARFDDQLKRTKKSRFAEDARFTDDEYNERDVDNADMEFMRAYSQQEFEPNFQIGRSRRKITLDEVSADKQRSRNMLQVILQDSENFQRGNQKVENIIAAVENRVRFTPLTEDNYDWSIWKVLFRILAGGRHQLVYNPRYATYNSLIYAIGDGFTNPKSKWFECHILTGDFDNNPDTMIDVVVLDSNNRLWIVNEWIVKLKMAPILRDRVARSAFPDPKL
jgi:hypothetical protein